MGTSFTNIQVFTPPEEGNNKLEIVIDAVRQWVLKGGFEEVSADEEVEPELLRTVIISPPEPEPWTGIYDEFGNEYLDNLRDFALFISKTSGFSTVSSLVADSDVTEMGLFKAGEEIDYYSSLPGYGEEKPLSRSEKMKLKGTPELWQEFLIPGKTPLDLRKIWNKKPIFAEEIQAATARVFGINEFAGGGFGYFEYLDQIGEPAVVTRLRFRAKRARSPFATTQEGLPKFIEPYGYSPEAQLFTETPVSLITSFQNKGGPGKGLRLVFWGTALDKGLVELEKVQFSGPGSKSLKERFMQVFQLTQFKIAEDVYGYEVLLPDFEFPGALLPDSETDFIGGVTFIRAYKAQLARSLGVYLSGKTLKEGQGDLHIGLVPADNPDAGQTSSTTHLEVKERPKALVGPPPNFNP
jgi:hypothetical protein